MSIGGNDDRIRAVNSQIASALRGHEAQKVKQAKKEVINTSLSTFATRVIGFFVEAWVLMLFLGEIHTQWGFATNVSYWMSFAVWFTFIWLLTGAVTAVKAIWKN